jgi:hypothetical protein
LVLAGLAELEYLRTALLEMLVVLVELLILIHTFTHTAAVAAVDPEQEILPLMVAVAEVNLLLVL